MRSHVNTPPRVVFATRLGECDRRLKGLDEDSRPDGATGDASVAATFPPSHEQFLQRRVPPTIATFPFHPSCG